MLSISSTQADHLARARRPRARRSSRARRGSRRRAAARSAARRRRSSAAPAATARGSAARRRAAARRTSRSRCGTRAPANAPPRGRSPRCSSVMRAPVANGIGKYALQPVRAIRSRGLTATSAARELADPRVRQPEEVAERHLDRRRRPRRPSSSAGSRRGSRVSSGERERAVEVRDAAGPVVLEQDVGLPGPTARSRRCRRCGPTRRRAGSAPGDAEQRRERKRPERMRSPIGAQGRGRTNGWLVA